MPGSSGAWTIGTKGPWPPSKFGPRKKRQYSPLDKFFWPPSWAQEGTLDYFRPDPPLWQTSRRHCLVVFCTGTRLNSFVSRIGKMNNSNTFRFVTRNREVLIQFHWWFWNEKFSAKFESQFWIEILEVKPSTLSTHFNWSVKVEMFQKISILIIFYFDLKIQS